MNEQQVLLLIDTDVLVNIRDKHNDSEEIWEDVISAIKDGRIKTVRQVMDELEKRFTDVFNRLKPFKETMLVPDGDTYSTDVISEIREIQQKHPSLYRAFGNNNSADPFLISVAKGIGATVVTDEKRTGFKHKKRIPYVCKMRNVGCMTRLEMFEAIGVDV